jgi:mono/diheme cytochrome c family protein
MMKNPCFRLMILMPILLFASCEYGRMWETPAVRPHEEPIIDVSEGTLPMDAAEAVYRATPAEELVSPVAMDDPDVVAAGSGLYGLYCVMCHGKYHDGYGTVGQSFQPLPGDLRSPRIQALSDGKMFKEISYGIPDGRQPDLATTIEVTDRWRIIAYVKSLGPR